MKLKLMIFLCLVSLPLYAHEWYVPHEHAPGEAPMMTFHEELAGGLAPTQQEAFEKWELSCLEWKQELKELNPQTLVSVNCGSYQHHLKKYYSKELHHYQSDASFVVRHRENLSAQNTTRVTF